MPISIACLIPTSLGFRCHLHLCPCAYDKLNCSQYAAMSNLMHVTAVSFGILTVLVCWWPCKLGKAVNLVVDEHAQIDSGLDSWSGSLPPLGSPPSPADVPAPPEWPADGPTPPEWPAEPEASFQAAVPNFSAPRAPSLATGGTTVLPCGGPASIPLQNSVNPSSVCTPNVKTAIHTLLACIDICVLMITMHIATTDASEGLCAQRKKQKRGSGEVPTSSMRFILEEHDSDGEQTEHTHAKQLLDLLTWHIGVLDAKWYVKPRSTCWFDEYLFNIYTPDMFYDILRMRRRTFDRLVHDLRPFIQGQHTHWRKPIAVEKKVVVALFKLMHGVPIPLVADKAALGKSTVHEILRQVCSAISTQFGHLIAWPVGRRLVRTATGFQTKQGFPNCIGAIDGSHIYVAAPSNTIVAADHRNRNKSFSILLQGVVDSKCYFTSINTGPPGSLHDSAHFKRSELYRRVEEGIMGGFHDDPLTWPACLPFPPYIVADRGYPLLSWCITPFKKGPMGLPLSREEAWFNTKHSSTRMSVERGFGILKARFKEIGSKSSLKLDFLPTVVHCCCVLHNILLASKDRTLDQILVECNLPPMDETNSGRGDEDEAFQPPRPMTLVSEERALLEGQMAREDILDYLVRTQNTSRIGGHRRGRHT